MPWMDVLIVLVLSTICNSRLFLHYGIKNSTVDCWRQNLNMRVMKMATLINSYDISTNTTTELQD